MRIANKLALSFVCATSLVFAAYGYRNVHREASAIESERSDDAQLLARTLVHALERLAPELTDAELASFCASASDPSHELRVRFVAAGGEPLAAVDPLAELTRLPLVARAAVRGFVEVERSRSKVEAETRAATFDWLGALAAATALKGALALVLGALIVGRPIRALVEHARRVGAGDLAARLPRGSRDELGALADEMNAMSERLLAARAAVAAEEQARLQAVEQLRHADRLSTIGRLAAGVAHEMGTPLNVVGGRAKLIAAREVEGEEALASARIIAEQSDRLARIIRQLLDFARRRPLERTRVNLGELASRTLEMLRPIAQKRSVERRCAPAPEHADADASQLQQALTNLVMNAIQAMPDGGAVDVKVDRAVLAAPADMGGERREWARIAVTDQGPGIAPGDLGRIFEPFFTTKQVGEGTGLGLSVAYGIVRDHGGWIDVSSTQGQGATFAIQLPLVAKP